MSARAIPYRPHNHDACVSQALTDARAICQRQNARLDRKSTRLNSSHYS